MAESSLWTVTRFCYRKLLAVPSFLVSNPKSHSARLLVSVQLEGRYGTRVRPYFSIIRLHGADNRKDDGYHGQRREQGDSDDNETQKSKDDPKYDLCDHPVGDDFTVSIDDL